MGEEVLYGAGFDCLSDEIKTPVRDVVNKILDNGSYKSVFVEWEKRPEVCRAIIDEFKHVAATRGPEASIEDVLDWLPKAARLRRNSNETPTANLIELMIEGYQTPKPVQEYLAA